MGCVSCPSSALPMPRRSIAGYLVATSTIAGKYPLGNQGMPEPISCKSRVYLVPMTRTDRCSWKFPLAAVCWLLPIRSRIPSTLHVPKAWIPRPWSLRLASSRTLSPLVSSGKYLGLGQNVFHTPSTDPCFLDADTAEIKCGIHPTDSFPRHSFVSAELDVANDPAVMAHRRTER